MKFEFNLKVLLLLLLFGLFFNSVYSIEDKLTITSPNYFGEMGNIYDDIHYLDNEFLSFKFCTDFESKDISFNLICNDDLKKELDLFDYNKNGGVINSGEVCYFSNFNLNEGLCDDFTLEISYNFQNKKRIMTRTFKKQEQSLLINHVLSKDINDLDSVDLSYYLIVLNNVESITSKKSIEVYNLLKNKRNNVNKCWPSSSCNILKTNEILQNLILAGYSLNSRILEDGNTYVESKVINNKNNPLMFKIELDIDLNDSEELECNLILDDDENRSYNFDNSDNLTIEREASSSIEFSCDKTLDNINFKLYNLNDKIQLDEDFEDSNSFNHHIDDFACIGVSDSCNVESTIQSLNTFSSKLEDRNLLDNYLDSLIVDNGDYFYFDTSNEYEDTGRYLFYNSQNNLLEHLKFKQNNDGSWGKENSKYDKIIKTVWAILGIEKRDSNSEYVDDGKKWVYYNEPLAGWGSIEKNTLAYLAIKEQIKPYIKINSINEISDVVTFKIENPTIYKLKDIKVSFSDEINSYLSYSENLGDLNGNDFILFNVSLNDDFFGKLTGDLFITGVDGKNTRLNLIEMPVNIKGPLPFDILVENYSLSKTNPKIEIKLKNNIDVYNVDCSIKNPFSLSKENFKVTNSRNNFFLENFELKEGNFSSELFCIYDGNQFTIPFKFKVTLVEKSFDFVDGSFLTISSLENFSFKIHNSLKDKQVLSFEVEGPLSKILEFSEKDKIIAGEDTRDIFVTIKNSQLLTNFNLDQGNESSFFVVKSDSGFSDKIKLEVNLEDSKKVSDGFNYILLVYIFLIIFVLWAIIFVIRRYNQQNEIEENNNPNNKNQSGDDEFILDDDFDF